MVKIMFVCHGNICRSPMAEFIFRDMLRQRGLQDAFEVASSATSTEEIFNGRGNPVYPPARRELLRHGIDPGDKRAVQLTRADYDRYDYLVCMDRNNFRRMERILGGDPQGKIFRLMEFAGEWRDVEDPWYTGDFETAYCDISYGCEALLEQLI